jgi:hypothetical protein
MWRSRHYLTANFCAVQRKAVDFWALMRKKAGENVSKMNLFKGVDGARSPE